METNIEKSSLLTWVRGFHSVASDCKTWKDLENGEVLLGLLNSILKGISPSKCESGSEATSVLSSHRDPANTWEEMASKLTIAYARLNRYLSNSQISGTRRNDLFDDDFTVSHGSEPAIQDMTLLVLGVAVFGNDQETYIQDIMNSHDENVQADLMAYIQDLMDKHYTLPSPQTTPMSNANSTHNLKAMSRRDRVLSPNLQRDQFTTEQDANITDSETDSSPALSRTHSISELEHEVMRLRQENAEFKQHKKLSQNDECDAETIGLRHEVDNLRNELDSARAQVWTGEEAMAEMKERNAALQKNLDNMTTEYDKAGANLEKLARFEKDVLHYKRKLEKVKVLEKRLKVAEDSNKAYVAENLELTQKVKRLSARTELIGNTTSSDIEDALRLAETDLQDTIMCMAETEQRAEEAEKERDELLETVSELRLQFEARETERTEDMLLERVPQLGDVNPNSPETYDKELRRLNLAVEEINKENAVLENELDILRRSGGAVMNNAEHKKLLEQNNALLRENSVLKASGTQWEKDVTSLYNELLKVKQELNVANEYGTNNKESLLVTKRLKLDLERRDHLIRVLKLQDQNTKARHCKEQELVVSAWYDLNLQQYTKQVADYLPGYSAASWLEKQRRMAQEWDALPAT
eukprot:CFRG5140T1